MVGTWCGCSLPISHPNFEVDANAMVNVTCNPELLPSIPHREFFGLDRKQLLFSSLHPALGMIYHWLHTCHELFVHLKVALAKKTCTFLMQSFSFSSFRAFLFKIKNGGTRFLWKIILKEKNQGMEKAVARQSLLCST